MPFKKHMLLSYEPDEAFFVLSDEYFGDYILTVRVVTFWGLFDRVVKMKVKIPWNCDVKAFYEPKLNVWSTKK